MKSSRSTRKATPSKVMVAGLGMHCLKTRHVVVFPVYISIQNQKSKVDFIRKVY
jgi:hypothetical protein